MSSTEIILGHARTDSAMEAAGGLAPDWLRRRAVQQGAETALISVASDGSETALTWRDWDLQSRALAGVLRSSCRPGDRVLLAYGPGPGLLLGLFGCAYAGLIGVPAYPPRRTRHGDRLEAVLKDSQAAAVLADAVGAAAVRKLADEGGLWSGLRLVEHERAIGAVPLEPERLSRPDAADVAYLQYTSGSTGDPKGVMVTYGSLAKNLEVLRRHQAGAADLVMVNWVPLFHDLGLVYGGMLGLFCGGRTVLIPPNAFLQDPAVWLEALSRHGGTHSAAPNFAYDLCVDRIPEARRRGWRLDRWRVALNGAEPVRRATLERFERAFEPWGLRAGVLRPSYGLAEATLYVSGAGDAPVPASPGTSVLCGPVQGMEARIVDPETLRPCAEGQVGELWLRGGSLCAGYWRRPELSAAVFGARCADGSGPWLRTGDLGSLRAGWLQVGGRLKDMIILRGVNHFAEDLEACAAAASGAAIAAAFGVDGPEGEAAVLVLELPRARREQAAAAAEAAAVALADEHGIRPREILCVPPGAIPRTSSGKVQRRACRLDWQAGRLQVWGRRQDGVGPDDGGLAGFLRSVGQDPDGELNAPEDWGLDSLRRTELCALLGARWGRTLDWNALSALRAPWTVSGGPAQVPGVEQAATPAGESRVEGASAETVAPSSPDRAWRRRAHPALAALWAAQMGAESGSAYHIAWSLGLDAAPDAGRLSGALRSLAAAEPVLRARFEALDGELWLVADGAAPALEALAPAAGADEAREILLAWSRKPFDPARAPLWRCALLPLAAGGARLALCFHHLIFDQRSWAVFHQRLQAAFDGNALAPGEWLEPGPAAPEADRAYWARTLGGLRCAPWERPVPVPGRLAVLRAECPESLLAPLLRRVRQAHATPFNLAAAAWGDACARISGAPEALVAVPTTLRERPLSEQALGYWVHPMPLRLGREEGSLESALRRAQEQLWGAMGHRALTLGEALRAAGSLAAPGSYLVYQGELQATVACLGQDAAFEPLPGDQAKSPVALEIAGEASWSLRLEYDPNKVGAGQAEGLLSAFIERLSGWAGEDAAVHGALSLLSGEASIPDGASTVIEAFHRQVSRRSEAKALVFDDGAWTYGELSERVRSVAQALVNAGVGAGERVGVLATAGPEWAAAVLACFEASAVYVPLDPAYPDERLRSMLGQAPCRALLVLGAAPAWAAPFTVIDLREALGTRPPFLRRPGEPRPEDAAYVIFTSGSSGSPKGVQVSHGALRNHAVGYADALALAPTDRVLQFVSISFDPSLEELLPTLIRGAALVLMRRSGAPSAQALTEILARQAVSILHLPAAYWHAWMGAGGGEDCRSLSALRAVVCGGESPDPAAVAALLRARGGACEFFNAYGPTESCITVSLQKATASALPGGPLPLGQPLSGVRLAVVQGDGRLCSPGQEGELWIGGLQLADGHLRDGALVQDAFCQAALATAQAERWYRSGDRVCLDPERGLLFRGRMDRQKKLAGIRLDLEEVEALLLAQPGVAAAVAEAVDDHGETRVAAWACPQPGAALNADRLRAALKERLPAPCVPLRIGIRGDWPLNEHGKVDRRALVAALLETALPPSEAPIALPALRGDLQAVCACYAEALKAESVGPDEDFFELGGSSLKAVRLAALLEGALGRTVSVEAVLQAPTPASLLRAMQGGAALNAVQPLAGERGPLWVLFPPVSGSLSCYRDLAQCLGGGHRVVGLELEALAKGPEGWDALVERCADALQTALPEEPLHLGGWSMGGLLAVDVARSLQRRGRATARLALIDTLLPDPVHSALLDDDPGLLEMAFDRDLAALQAQGLGERQDDGPWRERFRRHAAALGSFRPRPLECPLSYIVSERSARQEGQHSWMAWGLLARRGMTTLLLPGDHYGALSPSASRRVARRLTEDLAERAAVQQGGRS